ncbi:Protein DCL homolog, chloroplastic [Linum grandiflorum]
MAASLLLKSTPLLRFRLHYHRLAAATLPPPLRRTLSSTPPDSTQPHRTVSVPDKITSAPRAKKRSKSFNVKDPDYRKWRDKEDEILRDVKPIILLVKRILHSDRYCNGALLEAEDAKVVVQKLLTYHPNSEDKIGCGFDSIMVDCHPQFKQTRCLFVVRTDGSWIDFSYQKCLRTYIRHKYPDDADRFIEEHLKRGSNCFYT